MFDSRNFSVEENEEDDDNGGLEKADIVNSKTINDILKYGAHQSVDSNPVETQSEWSDDDERDDDEAKGVIRSIRLESIIIRFFFLHWNRWS